MSNHTHLTALPDHQGDSNDDIGLLSGSRSPAITTTTAVESISTYRGVHSRQHSAVDDMNPDENRPTTRERFLASREAPTPKVRRQSPGPSTASSIIRRMTTLRTPLSRFRSIATRSGGQYATLEGENESDQVPVDISTLEGLGFELRNISPNTSERFQNEETEYMRSQDIQQQERKLKRRTVGGGMKHVGAQLRRNPSSSNPIAIAEDSVGETSSVDRTKSVRDIGVSIAREKNVIVEVSEAVDLSSYEGHQPLNHRASMTFDSMLSNNHNNRRSTLPQETKSYFFPDDPDIPNWKPISMRPIYILFLTVGALALAIIQEILCRKSLDRAEQRSGLLAFNKVANISTRAFFSWKYLPTMVAIVYAVLFSIMDFDIRRLEPYYQLSQPQGARAAASLNLDHLTMFQYFIPFKAFRLRQWAVFFSTTGNIVASMVGPALQNPSLIFVPNDKCINDKCPGDEKMFWVRVSPIWSRLLSTSYAVIAIITLILFFQLRRKSGLLSDPKGIAGIASMATKSHILHEFAGLDQATRGEIHRKLQHRRFVLYKSSIWQGEWSASSEQVQESERRLRSPHPLMLRREGAFPLIAFMVVCLVGVPLISLTPARVVPNRVPWLPVLLATILKLLFTTFEADVRMMEPFYQLSLGNATPQNSITLDYQAPPYLWVVFKAVFNQHWLVALVGLASAALDILTVTVSSFSIKSEMFLTKTHGDTSSEDETKISFYVSLVLSITILTFVIIVTSLVFARRRHPFLPREPSTIAAVLAFVYASNMLTDFIDTERLSNADMEKRLKGIGKRYGLGWVRGRYGKINCAIDEEPMISKYVHGKPYTMAQAGPLQPAETFYSV